MAEFTERDRGRVTILDVTGEITTGVGVEQLGRAVFMAVGGGASTILLNLSGVTAMDSAGIEALYHSRSYADQRGADVKVASLPPKLRDFLQTELTPHFEIYDTEDAAVAAHGGESSA